MQLLQHLSIVALISLMTTAAGATSYDTCFNLDGSVSGVSYRCDNQTTGHTTCCQAGGVCYSNGVCKYDNEGREDYQRVGCTDNTWQDTACLKECEQYARGSTAGIRPCDGITEGNHYCCDDGSDGIASYQCCDNSSDIFILGTSIPTVLAQMPLSQTSTSTAAAATGPTSGSSSAGGGKTGGSSQTAVGVGVGLGVGIPFAVAVAGVVWFLTWRAGRKDKQQRKAAIEYDMANGQSGGVGGGAATAGMASVQGYSQVPQQQQYGYQAGQVDGMSKYEGYGVLSPQEMQAQPPPPTELPSTPRSELPS